MIAGPTNLLSELVLLGRNIDEGEGDNVVRALQRAIANLRRAGLSETRVRVAFLAVFLTGSTLGSSSHEDVDAKE